MLKCLQLVLILIVCCSSICYAQKIENGKRFRALVIGIDGAKGVQFTQRLFFDFNAPNLKTIAEHGQYADCQAVNDPHCAHTHLGPRFNPNFAWLTAPGWGTVLTGVNTNKHLIKNNDYAGQADFARTSQDFPTFLSQLKKKGFIIAVGGVGSFLTSNNIERDGQSHLSLGVVDFECGLNPAQQRSSVAVNAINSCNTNYRESINGSDPERDAKLAQWLLGMINSTGKQSPDLIMGVFDTLDAAGHHYGYASNPGYLEAISRIDAYVGSLLQAIQTSAAINNEVWLVIVTSDHGGHINPDGSGSHGNVAGEDEVVPLVVAVFGDHIELVSKGKITTKNATQMDVNPTVLSWFGIQQKNTDGMIRSQYRWNKLEPVQ